MVKGSASSARAGRAAKSGRPMRRRRGSPFGSIPRCSMPCGGRPSGEGCATRSDEREAPECAMVIDDGYLAVLSNAEPSPKLPS